MKYLFVILSLVSSLSYGQLSTDQARKAFYSYKLGSYDYHEQFDEIETQSVVQDNSGNFYVFMLSYDSKKYRGGCERIVYLNKNGALIWDKIFGECEMINNPIIAYIRSLKDGRVALRGHIVTQKPRQGEDPQYRFWEGWIDNRGKLIQKTGDVIDWANQDWEKLFKPVIDATVR